MNNYKYHIILLMAAMVIGLACSNEVPQLKQQIALQDSLIKASQVEQDALIKAYDQTFEELSIIASGGIPKKNPSETVEEYANFLEEREFMINNFKSDLNNLRSQLDDVTQQFNQAKQQIRNLRTQNGQLIEKNEELQRILDQKFREMNALTNQYEAAQSKINSLQLENTELTEKVNSLQTEISNLRKQLDVAESDLKSFYTAYYTIGTRKSLDRADIIRVRGIGKPSKTASINYENIREKMTEIDKRDKSEFIIADAKTKNITLLPLRDETSFTLEETENKQVIIRVTNADLFWSNSNYLVIIY